MTLVTGATGFLGAHLVRRAARERARAGALRVLVQSAAPAWLPRPRPASRW